MITIPTPIDPAFSPPTTTANEDALTAQADAFVNNLGRIIGEQGTTVKDRMTTTAVEFSELVAEPLKTNGALFMGAAAAAVEGAAYGSEVTAQLATAVTTFKQEITRLVEEWNAAYPLFGASPPTPGNVAAAKQMLLNKLNPQAAAAHAALLTAADDANSMLASGPTPANLQALAAGAGGGFLMFNAFGTQVGPPVINGITGTALAEQIRGMVERGETIPPALLDTVRQLALDAQRLGSLAAEQVDYLGSLFTGLDMGGLLQQMPEAIRGMDLQPGQPEMMLGALGGGILALSNSNLGGGAGMDRLPDSLKGVIERQLGINLGVGANHTSPTYQFAPMLAALRDPNVGLEQLEGGKELSAALTLEVAHANAHSSGYFDELARIDVIDVATRNVEANAALLGGHLQNPDYGNHTPEYVLRGVFGHDWHDDGAAASNLIGWIKDDAVSNDLDVRNRAANAAYSVFDNMTDSEVHQDLWGESALDFFRDSFGNVDGHERASVAVANPAIGMAMGNIVVPYFDFFEDADNTGSANLLTNAVDPITGDPYVHMDLTRASREDYFELVMANKLAGNALGEAAYGHVISEAAFADDWKDEHEAQSRGENAGTLFGLLDTGFERAFKEAGDDAAAETTLANQHVNWARSGAAAAKEIITELPGVRGLGRAANILVRETAESFKWLPGVAQAHDYVWGEADIPKEYDRESDPDYQQFQYAVVHAIVEEALADNSSADTTGLTLERVRDEADHRLVTTKDEQGNDLGYERFYTVDEVLQKDFMKTLEEPGDVLDHQKAREKLQRLFPDGSDESLNQKVNHYFNAFIIRRGLG